MVKPRFTYSLTKRQETFSVAYIGAVVAAAGYSIDKVEIDEDSIDVAIRQRGNPDDPDDYPQCPILDVQLKCTFAHQPGSDNYIHFPLSKKNYNDLRREFISVPSILVVLYIPSANETDWLVEREQAMLLQNTAHWISLRGEDALPDEQDSKTVLLPIEQRFNIDSLREIMNRLARGEVL